MHGHHYNWKRFWYPRGKEPSPWGDAFLPDPEHELMRYFSPDARSLSDLADVQCLILLGEPGLGKSFEIAAEAARLDRSLSPADDDVLPLNLGDFGETELVSEVFGHPKFEAWRKGRHSLHLWLDSFDEAAIQSQRLARIFSKKLRDIPQKDLGRLFLRIGCRDKDWPESLEETLKDLWSESEGDDRGRVQVRYLAPLRHKDVETATARLGVDSAAFMREVYDKDLSVFASRPLTLNLLLGYPLRGLPIPDGREQIFSEGCRRLCDETTDLRRSSMKLTPDERLRVAARISAMMLFAGKTAVSARPETDGSQSSDVLQLSEIIDHPESQALDVRPVTKSDVEETLATALFSHQGSGRARWSHQSYAEFLAAWYLRSHDMDVDQVMSLISHPRDQAGRLVPQLREVAAWLVTMVDEVFDRVLEVDPEVLVASDLSPADSERRQRLATTALQMFECGDLNPAGWHLPHYRRLAHPDIAAQVRPYLSERQDFRMRNTAIWIAAACTPAELCDDLLAIASDPSDDYQIRWRAVWALGHYHDAETILRLRPLAFPDRAQCPDDQLQSYALQALWPQHVSTEEVLANLGSNVPDQFLYHLRDSLSSEELPIVLSWLEQHDREGQSGSRDTFTDRMLLRGIAHLDRCEVSQPLACLTVRLLRRDTGIFRSRCDEAEKALSEPERRRLLLKAIVPLLDEPDTDAWRICGCNPPIAAPDDVPWLIRQFGLAGGPSARTMIAKLIDHLVVFYANPTGYEALLEVCESGADPELCALFSQDVKRHWPLSSRRIRQAQYSEYRQQIRRKRAAAKRPKEISPEVEIPRLLERIDNGDLWAYEALTRALARDPENTLGNDSWCPDLTKSSWWRASDAASKVQVLRASQSFAVEFSPPPDNLNQPGSMFYWEIAGYKALRLLLRYNPEALASLDTARWALWAPIVLRYPSSEESDEPSARQLAAIAYREAPTEMMKALRRILRSARDRDHLDLSPIQRLQDAWDSPLTDAALTEAAQPDFGADALQRLLVALLELGVDEARAFAESLLPLPPDAEDAGRARSAAAAAVLLNHAREGDWASLRPALFADRTFGLDAIARAIPHFHEDQPPFVQRLDLQDLADLYIWLHEQAPDHHGRPLDPIPKAKELIAARMATAGTVTACEQIQRIAERFPDEIWRKSQVKDAWERVLSTTWQPLDPAEVLDLIAHKDKRLVRSGLELLDAITYSLSRLQVQLRDRATADRLWNDDPCRPKEEKAFAREVRLYLEDDLSSRGVVLGCEVEVRPGQLTDIHCTAVMPQAESAGYRAARVIIETKGNWWRRIYADMKRQLADRYMAQNGCPYGIYLVGCFNCEKWDDPDDKRRNVSIARPIKKLRPKLELQARTLSTHDQIIRAVVLDCARHS